MKVLTVRQPWAHLIVSGKKKIENRTRRIHYRGPLLIQAAVSASPKGEWEHFLKERRASVNIDLLKRGGIIGICDVVDCVEDHDNHWFEGPFGWLLENASPLPFIPLKGQLSIFDPPRSVRQQIEPHVERWHRSKSK